MRIFIRHELRFRRDDAMAHSVQHVLMTPRDTAQQKIVRWEIAMPGFESSARFVDAFGNLANIVSQTRSEDDLVIVVSGTVETRDNEGAIGKLDADPLPSLFKRITPHTRPNGHLVNRLKAQQKSGMTRVEMLRWLMALLHDSREAQSGEDEDAPEIVADDFAHVFVAAARGMDIPARFVTGYVLPPPDTEARLHCWAEAFDEQLGWIGFDCLANVCPGQSYVRLAAGLDAETATPVRMVPDMTREADDAIDVRETKDAQHQQQQ